MAALVVTGSVSTIPATAATVCPNPVVSSAADPQIIRDTQRDYYYLLSTQDRRIDLRRSRTLCGLRDGEVKTVFTAPASGPNSQDLWAPEMHRIGNQWVIYYAATDQSLFGLSLGNKHFVLTNGGDPWTTPWTDAGPLRGFQGEDINWNIDGSVFVANGVRYFVWSGRQETFDFTSRIYIAKLSSPTQLGSRRVLISSPDYDWEKQGASVNEGPAALIRNGRVFLTYSGSFCNTDDYALGLLTASTGADLLNPASWRKSAQPVFTSSSTVGAYGTGHNSFVKSRDGRQDILVYHANSQPGQGCGSSRATWFGEVKWRADGTPNFGRPQSSVTLSGE